MMHAAPLHSPRLQQVLILLRDGRPHSTRDIVRRANVVAVSAVVAELRTHGADILCTIRTVDGRKRFFYKLIKEPTPI